MTRARAVLRNKWFYIILLAIGGVWWLGSGSSDNKKAAPVVRVTAAPVVRQDVPITVALVGAVIPYESVAVKARLDSQIVTVAFHDGDTVKEGQTLFELDDRALKAQIGQLKAELDKEKATLVNARLLYERNQKLVQTSAVSQAAVDQAKAQYQAQAAQVASAQATLDNQRVLLTYTTITAPIGGKTGTINVTRGNNVKANDATPLVTINQVSPIRVQFSVPQRYYEPLKTVLRDNNVKVTAQPKESGSVASGMVEYLDNTIDVANGTFVARAVFGNEDEKLWPGMFVNVTLDLGAEKNALTIPAVALQGDQDKHFVFTVDTEKKKAVKTPVEISINNGGLIVVTKGLKDDDQVIVDGLLRVTDGTTVDASAPTEGAKP